MPPANRRPTSTIRTANAALTDSGDTVIQQTQTGTTRAGKWSPRPITSDSPATTDTERLAKRHKQLRHRFGRLVRRRGRAVATADFGREDSAAGSETRYFFNADGSLKDTNADGIPDVAEGDHAA